MGQKQRSQKIGLIKLRWMILKIKKPEDWEKPELIPDPDAKKPDDWDDEEDGEWKPKQIDNPAYKGEWVHPEIDNPEYKADDSLYKYDDIGAVGFEIWQVKSGTIFDNIIVTDDVADAEAHAKETFEKQKDEEKKRKIRLMKKNVKSKKKKTQNERRKKKRKRKMMKHLKNKKMKKKKRKIRLMKKNVKSKKKK